MKKLQISILLRHTEMDSSKVNFFESEDPIDLGKIFRLLLMQSKLIFLITLICTALSIVYYINAERLYKISSLVQVFPNESQNFSNSLTSDFFLGSTNTTDINSIQQIYKSRSNIISIINATDINVTLEGVNYADRGFISRFKYLDFQGLNSIKFTISTNDKGFSILDENENKLLTAKYGERFFNEKFDLEVNKPTPNLLNKEININIFNPDSFYKMMNAKFSIESISSRSVYTNPFNNGAILEINYITPDVDEGINILNLTNENFIDSSIRIESEQARKALNYIESRADAIESQLNLKKEKLKNFREDNKTVDVDLEIQSIINNLNELEDKLNNIEIEIERAKNSFTENNPMFLNLLDQRQTLENQKKYIEAKIEELPLAQQEYIDLFRDLEITQEVFNELQNRKLEYSIREASTLGNMRVVDNAYVQNVVSPQMTLVVFTFIFSAFLSVILAIFRGLYFIPISNPAEIEDNGINIPIIGVIAKVDEESGSAEEQSERFSQSIESLIVNIQSGEEDKAEGQAKTIVFTSPTSFNGKSFVSRNVATKLSQLGNKVLLIDADFKRGDQHKSFEIDKITTKDFWNISDQNLESFKCKSDELSNSNLYVIPRISRLGSSFEYLYDARFSKQIDYLKERFDYIVIDTAPILSVSDTLILLTYGDQAFCIVRHGLTKMNEIRQAISIFNQIGRMPDGVIYNAYERPSSYYGYYGVYGNYSYQYYAKRYLYQSYDYENDKS